jgi:hypothetical protein
MAENTYPFDETAIRLARGRMELVRQFVRSWNHVFLVRVEDGEQQVLAVYKPRAGEYPLWDFPQGTLCLREVAAYRLSRALGWPRIPPTVLRDGPYGLGMVQQFIEADSQANYFTLRESRRVDLLPVALFDHLVNNTDRKGGHLLLDPDGRIWAIDHALTFHVEPKLRTVIWDFAGEPIPTPRLEDLSRLRGQLEAGQPLEQDLARFLSPAELDRLRERLDHLLALGRFPHPDPHRAHLPWPLV